MRELQLVTAVPDDDDLGSSVEKLTALKQLGPQRSLHSMYLIARSSTVVTRFEAHNLLTRNLTCKCCVLVLQSRRLARAAVTLASETRSEEIFDVELWRSLGLRLKNNFGRDESDRAGGTILEQLGKIYTIYG